MSFKPPSHPHPHHCHPPSHPHPHPDHRQVLVYLKGFREGDRVRLARCVAIWTSDSLLDPKVLTTLLQDHLVKDGLAADFLCEVSRVCVCVCVCLLACLSICLYVCVRGESMCV